jgi:anti-sigma regulatory factor (Ser/Thr protein kinase)
VCGRNGSNRTDEPTGSGYALPARQGCPTEMRVADQQMPAASDQILAVDVPCDADAARAVRAALIRMDWREGVNSDVLILASELVNNAVLHSGGAREDILAVRATLSVDRLTFSVRDPGLSGQDAQARPDGDSDTGGWGLRIVDQLASRWGSHRDGGYRVWAEMTVAGSPDPVHGTHSD